MTKILTIAGALRAESTNRQLVAQAASLIDGAEIQTADLNVPLYDGDLEDRDGLPASVVTLVDQILWADVIVISSPEYNKGISGVLKNALDWISRDKRGGFKGKPVAVMTAAAGRTGGETAQYMLRSCLVPLGADVVSAPQVAIASNFKEFETGKLENERYVATLQALMDALVARVG